jgi:hypothetical protein
MALWVHENYKTFTPILRNRYLRMVTKPQLAKEVNRLYSLMQNYYSSIHFIFFETVPGNQVIAFTVNGISAIPLYSKNNKLFVCETATLQERKRMRVKVFCVI